MAFVCWSRQEVGLMGIFCYREDLQTSLLDALLSPSLQLVRNRDWSGEVRAKRHEIRCTDIQVSQLFAAPYGLFVRGCASFGRFLCSFPHCIPPKTLIHRCMCELVRSCLTLHAPEWTLPCLSVLPAFISEPHHDVTPKVSLCKASG